MEKNLSEHSRIERLERLLKFPEKVTQEELEAWMRDEEFLFLYRTAMDARRSLLENTSLPDVKKAFQIFRQENMRKTTLPLRKHSLEGVSYKWIAMVSVACILLCVTFFIGTKFINAPENIQVYVAQNTSDEVILSVGGHTLSLTEGVPDSLVASLDFKIKAGNELSYDEKKREKEPAPQLHTLTTPMGKDFHIILSDGTHVWLNAGSCLTYPSVFTGTTRTIQLQGEAYFEVTKDEAHPFIVESGALRTTVLGTSFNVRFYEQEEPHVTLAEGSVNVAHRKQSVTLVPGEDATFNQEGDLISHPVNVQAFTSWKDGHFYFDGIAFKQMMIDLGRWYNMDVVFVYSRNLTDSLHLHAEREWDVHELVQQINQISEAKIRIEGNTLVVE